MQAFPTSVQTCQLLKVVADFLSMVVSQGVQISGRLVAALTLTCNQDVQATWLLQSVLSQLSQAFQLRKTSAGSLSVYRDFQKSLLGLLSNFLQHQAVDHCDDTVVAEVASCMHHRC